MSESEIVSTFEENGAHSAPNAQGDQSSLSETKNSVDRDSIDVLEEPTTTSAVGSKASDVKDIGEEPKSKKSKRKKKKKKANGKSEEPAIKDEHENEEEDGKEDEGPEDALKSAELNSNEAKDEVKDDGVAVLPSQTAKGSPIALKSPESPNTPKSTKFPKMQRNLSVETGKFEKDDSASSVFRSASGTPLASPGFESAIEFPKVRKSSERNGDESLSPIVGSYSPIHLESPRFSAGRSRASTAGSMDSRASGTIDDKSYFKGPEDKLVSRLVSSFEKFNDGDEPNNTKEKTRRTTSGKKKIDTSFLNMDTTIPSSRSSPTLSSPPLLLKKSSSEYFRKLAQAPDIPPQMPDLSSVNPWSSASSPRSPLSPSVSSAGAASIRLVTGKPASVKPDLEKETEEKETEEKETEEKETEKKEDATAVAPATAEATGKVDEDKGPSLETSPDIKHYIEPGNKPSALPQKDVSPSEDFSASQADDFIFGVCVVGFHHAGGPQVEYWIGPDGDQSSLWPFLAFQSLPDGSHTHEENFCYFTLLYDEEKKIAPNPTPRRNEEGHIIEQSDFKSVTTLFGISCSRQIRSEEIKNMTSDITRSIVQKSVVIIARKPIFGPIKDKLAIVTRAYFNQGDFQDRVIIDSLYESLRLGFNRTLTESDLIVGMPLRELIKRLGHQVLVILKALILEKRILFFASNSELLCASQFSLVSLIPNLINHLEDCGSPLLSTYETTLQKATSLKTSDRGSLMTYMGLPLQVFAAGGIFSPYVPLQQLSELEADETKHFLVGTTNSLIMSPSSIKTDVVVDMDHDLVTIHDENNRPDKTHGGKKLSTVLNLSHMDRKWIDNIVKAVNDTWDPEDPLRPSTNGFYGSEDFIRMQFEDYILHMLASVKYDEFIANGGQLPPVHKRENMIKMYNMDWINEWKYTNNYRIFNNFTDPDLFDIAAPKHLGASPFGISTILNGSAPLDANESPPKGVAKLFGNIWGQKSSSTGSDNKNEQDSASGSKANRLSMASLKNTLSDLRSNSSSTISIDQSDKAEAPVILDGNTSAHQSQVSLNSSSSRSTQVSSSSTEEKKGDSKEPGYLASWSNWATAKRKQLVSKPEPKNKSEDRDDDDKKSEISSNAQGEATLDSQ